MRVEAKGGKDGAPAGFYGSKLRKNGEQFTLIPLVNSEGKVVSTPKQQFSELWMKEVETKKRKRRSAEQIKADEEAEIAEMEAEEAAEEETE